MTFNRGASEKKSRRSSPPNQLPPKSTKVYPDIFYPGASGTVEPSLTCIAPRLRPKVSSRVATGKTVKNM